MTNWISEFPRPWQIHSIREYIRCKTEGSATRNVFFQLAIYEFNSADLLSPQKWGASKLASAKPFRVPFFRSHFFVFRDETIISLGQISSFAPITIACVNKTRAAGNKFWLNASLRFHFRLLTPCDLWECMYRNSLIWAHAAMDWSIFDPMTWSFPASMREVWVTW